MLYIFEEIKSSKNHFKKWVPFILCNQFTMEEIQVEEVQFTKIFFSADTKKVSRKVKKQIGNDPVWIPKDKNWKEIFPNSVQLQKTTISIEIFFQQSFHILCGLENEMKHEPIVIIDLDGNYQDYVGQVLEKFSNVHVVTKEVEFYETVAEKFLEELGASLQLSGEEKYLEHAVCLDLEEKHKNYGQNNLVFSPEKLQCLKGQNVNISHIYPNLKKKYLNVKPKELFLEEYYDLLKQYCDFSDEINKNRWTCFYNDQKIEISQCIEKIKLDSRKDFHYN